MPRILPLITLFLAPATALAQEPEASTPSSAMEESRYRAPDWIPGTTELYYGPSFLDRSATPVRLTQRVDLGLIDVQVREMPMGGAEHVGALFFALEEEVQPSFPMTELPHSCCPQQE